MGLHRMLIPYIRRLKARILVTLLVSVVLLSIITFFTSGLFLKWFELDFNAEFSLKDNRNYVNQLRYNKTTTVSTTDFFNYSYLWNSEHKCRNKDPLDLVYIVKSTVDHFERRQAIRNTWGSERRCSDMRIRTVFVLGMRNDSKLQGNVNQEQKEYQDIVQGNFIDAYFNNTIKSILGMKWAVTYCPYSKYYMFVDDDVYVSTKNVFNFLRNPEEYPMYLEDPTLTKQYVKNKSIRTFRGWVVPNNSPSRRFNSKWFISLSEYPYNIYPPFVAGFAYVVCHESLHEIYFGSFFIKPFGVDDAYIGIVAKTVGIVPQHHDQFNIYKQTYSMYTYKHIIASHGFSDPNELLRVWNLQYLVGFA